MTRQDIHKQFERRKTKHLVSSILIDLAGMATYLIPGLAEVGDLIFAPLSALAIFVMYRIHTGSALVGSFGGFVEEILPGTDVIPSATLMWAYTYVLRRDKTLNKYVKRLAKDHKVIEETARQLD